MVRFLSSQDVSERTRFRIRSTACVRPTFLARRILELARFVDYANKLLCLIFPYLFIYSLFYFILSM